MSLLRRYLLCLIVGLLLTAPAVYAETVSLPITIDYQLLRTLVVQKAYTNADQSATVMDAEDGCNTVHISEPSFEGDQGLLKFDNRVVVLTGQSFGDYCLVPMRWHGILRLWLRPHIDPKTWRLTFKTERSALYGEQGQPATLDGIDWDAIQPEVYAYIDQVRIDLEPPVADLKSFLTPLFAEDHRAEAMRMLDSMRAGDIVLNDQGVRFNVLADVETVFDPNLTTETETIAPDQLKRVIRTWETWDALLVKMITSLAGKSLNDNDRQLLLEALLETRHRFSQQLAGEQIAKDFVRTQFVMVWEQIAPVFRKHLAHASVDNALGYLAFFTASDALTALDKLGPTLGIEISRNGLIRLARMLDSTHFSGLEYQPGINNTLREMLGFDPLPVPTAPQFEDDQIELVPETEPTGSHHRQKPLTPWAWLGPARVWAQTKTTEISMAEILSWAVPRKNIAGYVQRVRRLLEKTASGIMAKEPQIATEAQALFTTLVVSTAWQESCMRQFRVKKNA